MEQQFFKSAWQDDNSASKSNAELKAMMQEKRHPVLKRIRRQLIIETIGFTAFLLVYYDFFDGDRKPLFANVLLLAAVLLAIVHNVIGYMLTKRRIEGDNIKQSLEAHLSRMKLYAFASVASRVLTAACVLTFFASVITFTTQKYWILAGTIAVFIVQVMLLSGIWAGRIRHMKGTLAGFSS